jgi:multidrug efflux pump subunit AcrA (membrane-fusion protein)
VGSLKAKDEATLFSRVPGKLKQNLVKEGDPVRKGQPVALVERDEVGVRFEPAPVPSTLNGVVGRVYLDRGADVTLNTPVALIADVSEVIAKADVPERYAGRVRPGQDVRVRVEAFPERTFPRPGFPGQPRRGPRHAQRLHGGPARQLLGPAALGHVRQPLHRRDRQGGRLAVPIEAVTDGSGPSIFVIKDGKAVKREVVEGLRTETHVEIKEGLSPASRSSPSAFSGSRTEARSRCSPRRAGREEVKLADVSISRPIFATMMIAALVVLGLFSYGRLGVDLFPTSTYRSSRSRRRCAGRAPRRSRPPSPSRSRRRSTPSRASTSFDRPASRA